MQLRVVFSTKPTEEELSALSEALAKLLMEVLKFNEIAPHTAKASKLLNDLSEFDKAAAEFFSKILAIDSESVTLRIREIRDQLKSSIDACLLHYMNHEKRKANVQEHMRETYRFIMKIDECYKELQKIKDDLKDNITVMDGLLKQIISLGNDMVEVIKSRASIPIHVGPAENLRMQSRELLLRISEKIRTTSSILSKEEDLKLLREATLLMHRFMHQEQIAKFIVGTKMQLAYTPDPQTAAQSSTAAISSAMNTKPVVVSTSSASAAPLQTTTVTSNKPQPMPQQPVPSSLNPRVKPTQGQPVNISVETPEPAKSALKF